MRHVVKFSAGGGSWAAAKRVAAEHGTAGLTLLFTDVLIEDEDAYRFLIEGAANVFGVDLPSQFVPDIASFPGLDDMQARTLFLRGLAAEAMDLIPGLTWIMEGRDPWQIFFDERFLGNSGVAPCSKIAKRRLADRWLGKNCDPAETVIYVGIDWTEEHRFDDGKGGGARPIWSRAGWRAEAPMLARPFLSKQDVTRLMKFEGIRPPRLYGMGFAHNNCGGFCVKAGQGHFANLLRTMPERYAYHERREQEIREYLGADVSMMTDRRGGAGKRPLTMKTLRERIERGGQVDLFEVGGCGCFLDGNEPTADTPLDTVYADGWVQPLLVR